MTESTTQTTLDFDSAPKGPSRRTGTAQTKRQSRSGFATGIPALKIAQKKHPGNPKQQISLFAAQYQIIAATGRARPVSEKTRSDMINTLVRCIDELRAHGMPVRNLGEIGQAHVLNLLRLWLDQDQAAATIQTKISFLRRFLTVIGKSHILPKGEEFMQLLSNKGIDRLPLKRSQSAVISKSWSSSGIRLEEVLQRIAKYCPITASQVEMQAAFGLRVSESLQIEPEISDMGDRVSVYRGTKGGKTRVVYFDDDEGLKIWQRDVLERAKVHARKHPKRRLAVGNVSLVKARYHYYNVIRKAGITRNDLGVTSHGLRHEFAARKYEQLTGMRPQVEAAQPSDIYRQNDEQDHLARLEISQQLGHWRKDVTSAYIGSTTSLARESRNRIRSSLGLIEGNEAAKRALKEHEVKRLWLTGKTAWGLPLSVHEKLNLTIQIEKDMSLQDLHHRMSSLVQRLDAVIERGVSLSLHLGSGQPQDSLEVFFTAGS